MGCRYAGWAGRGVEPTWGLTVPQGQWKTAPSWPNPPNPLKINVASSDTIASLCQLSRDRVLKSKTSHGIHLGKNSTESGQGTLVTDYPLEISQLHSYYLRQPSSSSLSWAGVNLAAETCSLYCMDGQGAGKSICHRSGQVVKGMSCPWFGCSYTRKRNNYQQTVIQGFPVRTMGKTYFQNPNMKPDREHAKILRQMR